MFSSQLLSQSSVNHAFKHTTILKINMHDAHNNNTCNKSFLTQNYHFDIIFQDLRTSLWEFYFFF